MAVEILLSARSIVENVFVLLHVYVRVGKEEYLRICMEGFNLIR